MGLLFIVVILVASIALLYLLLGDEKDSIKKTIFYNPAPETYKCLFIFLDNNSGEEALITLHFPLEHKEFFRNVMTAVKERILSDGYFSNTEKKVPSLPMEVQDGYIIFDKNWKNTADENIFLNFIIPSKYSDYVKQIFQEEFVEQKFTKTSEIEEIPEEETSEPTQAIENPNDRQLSDIINSCNQLNSSTSTQENVSISIPETSVLSEDDLSSLVAGSEILSEKDYSTVEESAEKSPPEESDLVQAEIAIEEKNTSEIEVVEVEEEINNEPEIQQEQTSPVVENSEEISAEETFDETQSKEIPQEISEEFTEKAHIEAVDQQTSEEQQENISESIPEELPVEIEEEQQEVLTTNECMTENAEVTSTDDVDQKVTVLAFEYSMEYAVSQKYKFDFAGKFELKVFNGNQIALTKMKQPKLILMSNNPSDIETFLKCIKHNPTIFILAGLTYKKILENIEEGKIFMPISFKDQVILFYHEEEVIPGLPIGVYVLEYPS